MRTMGCLSDLFSVLDDKIDNCFLPALFGRDIENTERKLFSLPCRSGGLGIPIMKELAKTEYETSQKMTSALTNLILRQSLVFEIDEEEQKKIEKEIKKEKEKRINDLRELMLGSLVGRQKRSFEDSGRKGSSTWLSANPLASDNFCLNRVEFRDTLNLRYGKMPDDLPAKCNCIGTPPFILDHALSCHLGGHVDKRHNDVRDTVVKEMNGAFKDVQKEQKRGQSN